MFFIFSITSPLNKYFKDYFPIELIKTHDLDSDGKYLLCSHPHGVMPAGILCSLGTKECGWFDKFPGLLFSLNHYIILIKIHRIQYSFVCYCKVADRK